MSFLAYRDSVVINEVAWAGTAASADDEWIELWNPGSDSVALEGWVLTDGNDVTIHLNGSIGPGEYFLLERGGDDTVSDIAANQIYTGALSNSGETLRLLDPAGNLIDSAGGSPWPAGAASPLYASMERASIDPPSWMTNTGYITNGRDAHGGPIRGTPGRPNSALFPTPSPTKIPRGVLINEFVPKPGSDWNQDGSINYYDEFIELLNTNSIPIDLGGWMLDDRLHGGSHPYTIHPGTVIHPKEYPCVLPQPDASRAQRRGRRGVVAGAGRARGGRHALHPNALARQRLGPVSGRGRQAAARLPADAGGTEPSAARSAERRSAPRKRRSPRDGAWWNAPPAANRSPSAEDFSPPAGKNQS